MESPKKFIKTHTGEKYPLYFSEIVESIKRKSKPFKVRSIDATEQLSIGKKGWASIRLTQKNSDKKIDMLIEGDAFDLFYNKFKVGNYYTITNQKLKLIYQNYDNYDYFIVLASDSIVEKVDADLEDQYDHTQLEMAAIEAPNSSIVNFSVERLKKYLISSTGMNEQDLKIFEDECITGESFLELTQEDLTKMGIKLGPTKILLKIISNHKKSMENTTCVSRNNENATNGSLMCVENKRLEINSPQCSNSETNLFTSSMILDKVESIDNNSSLNNATKKRKLNNLYKNFTRFGTVKQTIANYKEGRDILESLEQSKQVVLNNMLRKVVRIIVHELVEVQGPKPNNNVKLQLAKAVTKEFPIFNNKVVKGKVIKSVGYKLFFDPKTKKGYIHNRLQVVNRENKVGGKTNFAKSINIFSNTVNEIGISMICGEKKVLETNLPQCPSSVTNLSTDFKTLDKIASTDNNSTFLAKQKKCDIDYKQFTRFETVKQTIANYKEGRDILESLEQSKFHVSEILRKKIVEIIVDELVRVQGFQSNNNVKLQLAKAVTQEFPIFNNKIVRGKCVVDHGGYKRFFDPDLKTGSIQNRLLVVLREYRIEKKANVFEKNVLTS